jgi:tetratricopeptide (TPR) repeat protein
MAGSYHWLASDNFPELYPKAKEAALKALALDDTLAEAHGALAFTLWRHDWDFAGAEREFKKSAELAPNSYIWAHAQFLSSIGKHDEAIRKIKTAQDLDPATLMLRTNVAWVYVDARQFDDAITQFRRVLELAPKQFEAQSGLCTTYVLKGMPEEAVAECQKALELSIAVGKRANIAWALAEAGKRSQAIKILNDLKNPSIPVSDWRIAVVYSGLGETDLCIAHLEKAYAKRTEELLWLKVDPRFDDLRSDPRFSDLIRRIGFPQ